MLPVASNRTADPELAGLTVVLPHGDPFRENCSTCERSLNIQFF